MRSTLPIQLGEKRRMNEKRRIDALTLSCDSSGCYARTFMLMTLMRIRPSQRPSVLTGCRPHRSCLPAHVYIDLLYCRDISVFIALTASAALNP